MKTAILNICITAAGISLLKMIIPNNRLSKQMNFMISCFFTAGVILAFSGGKINLPELSDNSGITYVDFSEQSLSDKKRQIASEISERVKAVLQTVGIIPEEIYVIVNISSYNSISINEIKLVLSADDDYQKATDAVLREVGNEIKVSIEIA